MIPLGGHDLCVHKGHHSCLPTLRPDGRALTLTRKELLDTVDRVIGDAGEHFAQVSFGLHIVQFGCSGDSRNAA
jgi:hypothetical protein